MADDIFDSFSTATVRSQVNAGIKALDELLHKVRQLNNSSLGKLESAFKGLTVASGTMRAATTASAELSRSMQQLTVRGNDVHSMARGLASGFNLLWLTWGNLAPLFAGAAISFGVRKAFDIGSEVEYTIKQMEILGQTVENQGTVIREQLRAIDQTTLFSVKELGAGMVRLGQAGKTPAEALSMLRPAADLAAVGMTDLKTSIDLLIQTQALFGKSSEDAGKIAAQIFKVTTAGVLNVKDISGSMKYASEANTRFGKSLEETLVLLGALAQAGLKGSSGGTALINFYRDLNGRSGPAVAAMKQLEKATKTQIKVFDELGKQRSGIDIFTDIANAAGKLDAASADKILAKIFSDRGGRTFFAMVRDGTVDLQKMLGVLEDVKPESLFDAAKGLMDTTKGAFDIMKGSFVGSLDQVFEVYEKDFKNFFKDMAAAASSDEFKLAVAGIVDSVKGLYLTVKEFLPVVTTFFGIWAGFKVLSFGITAFQALSSAIAVALPTLVMTTTAYRQQTFAVLGNSEALITNAVAQRAVAAGATTAQAAVLGQAAATRVMTASAGFATLAVRGLTAAIAFLANPVVGLVATVGLLAYSWFSVKSNAETAMSGTAIAVTSNGKVIESQLLREIALATQRNSLLGGDHLAESEVKLANKRSERDALKAEADRYTELSKTSTIHFRERWAQQAVELNNKVYHSDKEITQAEKMIQADRQRTADLAEKRRLKAESDAEKAAAKAKAAANGIKVDPAAKPGRQWKERPDQEKLQTSNLIQELDKRHASELSRIKAQADAEKAIIDAKHSAGLISAGAYAAQAYEIQERSDKNQLDQITKNSQEFKEAYEARKSEIEATMAKSVAKNPKMVEEAKAPFEDELKKLEESKKTHTEKTENEIEKIVTESNKRKELSLIALQGQYLKVQKESEKFWREQERETSKTRSDDAMNEQFRFINESLFSADAQLKAYATTYASELEKFAGHQEELKIKLQDATVASEEFFNKNQKGIESGEAAAANYYTLLLELENQAKANLTQSELAAPLVAVKRATLAATRAFNEQKAALTTGLADAVETGLFEGGDAGAAKLRDLLEQELLRKPFRVFLQGIMEPISGALLGGKAGIGGQAGTTGGGLPSLSGAFSSGMTEAFSKFATSSIGEKLGLSVKGPDASGYNMLTESSQELSKTFSQAAGIIGSAVTAVGVQKALSGGYKTGESALVDTATAIGSYFDPTGGYIAGAIGGTFNRAFGRKFTGSGIEATFGGKEGFTGRSYEDYKGGWFRSDKTNYGELDKPVQNLLTSAFRAVQLQTGGFAQSLGLTADKIADFTTTVKIKTDGLDEAGVIEAINEGIKKGADELAQQVLGSFETVTEQVVTSTRDGDEAVKTITSVEKLVYVQSEFARAGETASETLNRLGSSLLTANKYAKLFGDTTYEGTLKGADAASTLADAFGGVEQFQTDMQNFYSVVASPMEQTIAGYTEFRSAIDSLGVEIPNSAVGMKLLANSMDLTTEAGRQSYATLIKVGPQYLAAGEALLQSFGTSTEELAGILVDGLRNSDPAGAGQYFADTIVYGIENALYQNMGAQITQIVTNGIIAPLMQSMLLGETAAVAISKLSIASVTKQVQDVTAFFSALFNNSEWITLMDTMKTGLAGVVGGALSSIPVPRFEAPVNPWDKKDSKDNSSDTSNPALDAAKAADDAWKSLLKTLTDRKLDADIQNIYLTQGKAAGLAAERAREYSGMIEGLTVTQEVAATKTEAAYTLTLKATEAQKAETATKLEAIYALEDYNKALEGLAMLKDEAKNLEIELLRALGKEEEALTKEREIAIKDMSLMEVAQYDLNQSTKDLIKQLETFNDSWRDSTLQALDSFATPYAKVIRDYTDAEKVLRTLGGTLPKSKTEFLKLVSSLDYTKKSGQDAAKALDKFIPAMQKLEDTVYSAFGITEQTIIDISKSILKGELKGEEAGQALADSIYNGVQDVIATTGAQAVAQTFMQYILQPIVAAMMAGSSLSEAMTSPDIQTGIRIATETAGIYSQILGSTEFKQLGQMFLNAGNGMADSVSDYKGSVTDYTSATSKANTATDNLGGAYLDVVSDVDKLTDSIKALGAAASKSADSLNAKPTNNAKSTTVPLALSVPYTDAIGGIKAFLADSPSQDQIYAAIQSYGVTNQMLSDATGLAVSEIETLIKNYEATLAKVSDTVAPSTTETLGNAASTSASSLNAKPTHNELTLPTTIPADAVLGGQGADMQMPPKPLALSVPYAEAIEVIKAFLANSPSQDQIYAAIQSYGVTNQMLSDATGLAISEIETIIKNYEATLTKVSDTVYPSTPTPVVEPAAPVVTPQPTNYIPNRDLAGEKQQVEEGLKLQAELYRLQGGELKALSIEYDLATAAMQPLVKALYDKNEALRKQIAILTEQKAIEDELLDTLGNTVEIRRRELLTINENNRGLKQLVWNLQDAKEATDKALQSLKDFADKQVQELEKSFETTDKAYAALERSFEAQKKAAETQVEQSTKVRDNLKGVFDLLKDQVKELRGEVESTSLMQAVEGRRVIHQAVLSGVVPEQKVIEDAVAAARKGVEDQNYSSKFDRDKAYLILSNDLEALKNVTEPQLTEAEKTLEVANLQLANSEELLKRYKDQIDVMRGVDVSVIGVDNAVSKLESAIQAETLARDQIAEIKLQVELAQKQYDTLRGIDSGITSMVQALGGFRASISAEIQAVAAAQTLQPAPIPIGYITGAEIGDIRGVESTVSTSTYSLADYQGSNSGIIAGQLQSAGVSLNSLGGNLTDLYQAAIDNGIVPQFAEGGSYQGGLALVGEEGPELINFDKPGQVYTASQTKQALGNDNAELVAEIRALREENKAQAGAIVRLQSQLLKFISRWDGDGMPKERVETA